MDKRMYITVGVLFLLFMVYYFYVEDVIRPKHPEWDWNGQNSQLAQEGVSSAGQATTQTQPGTGSGGAAGPAAPGLHAMGAVASGPGVMIGSEKENDADYALGLELNRTGASLDSAVINQFKSAEETGLYSFQEPYGADWSSLATRAVEIGGVKIIVTGLPWTLESSTDSFAIFGMDIVSAQGKALAHVTKTYKVEERGPKQNRDNTAAGYEADVDYAVTNLSDQAQTVRLDFDGPTMPPREAERQDDRQIVTGYDQGNQAVNVVRYGVSDFKPESPAKDLSRSSNGYQMLWSGMSSLYFTAIVQPVNEGQVNWVVATAQNPQDPVENRIVTMGFETADLQVAPGATVDVPLKVLLAPKERGMLEGDYFRAFPRGYNQLLVTTSGLCGMCAFSWLIDFLVAFLIALHWVLHDWGLSIIALVIVVRLILHPITKSSMVSTMKMQKMGPELERLKKKFGDDKEGFNKAQVELYKEMGFTPLFGCLPMFLQMPIWIALYSALQTEIALRQARFLWGLTWIHDLARPDRLIAWDSHAVTLPLIGHVAAFNLLPILMGIGYFLQQKYTPKPPAMTPEQASQQKMMQWMTLLFPLFLYNAPSGLNLYILTSGGLGALENKRIRDHIKQRDEAEKAGKTFVDTRPTRQGKQQKKDDGKAKDQKKQGFLAKWWGDLQNKAEDIRREAERRKRKNEE
jgi:YidC/Oxa1 family membrane protein insertase